jgi:hypothetical protein
MCACVEKRAAGSQAADKAWEIEAAAVALVAINTLFTKSDLPG